jgi:hypothetical protein
MLELSIIILVRNSISINCLSISYDPHIAKYAIVCFITSTHDVVQTTKHHETTGQTKMFMERRQKTILE